MHQMEEMETEMEMEMEMEKNNQPLVTPKETHVFSQDLTIALAI
jgi:hypothetical protein